MTEIIIDASAVLAVLLDEPERGAVVSVTDGTDFLAPVCVDFEIGSALSALIKRGCLDTDTDAAAAVYHEFLKIPVRRVKTDIPYALVIAGEEGMYAYDAYYLACAKRVNVSLLSVDRRLRTAAEKRGITCLL